MRMLMQQQQQQRDGQQPPKVGFLKCLPRSLSVLYLPFLPHRQRCVFSRADCFAKMQQDTLSHKRRRLM